MFDGRLILVMSMDGSLAKVFLLHHVTTLDFFFMSKMSLCRAQHGIYSAISLWTAFFGCK